MGYFNGQAIHLFRVHLSTQDIGQFQVHQMLCILTPIKVECDMPNQPMLYAHSEINQSTTQCTAGL